MHPLVFDAYRSVPVLHRKHTLPDQALLFAALIAVIVGLSALAYYLVEKPMQGLGRRVAARFGYATGTASGAGAAGDRLPEAGAPGRSAADGDARAAAPAAPDQHQRSRAGRAARRSGRPPRTAACRGAWRCAPRVACRAQRQIGQQRDAKARGHQGLRRDEVVGGE